MTVKVWKRGVVRVVVPGQGRGDNGGLLLGGGFGTAMTKKGARMTTRYTFLKPLTSSLDSKS